MRGIMFLTCIALAMGLTASRATATPQGSAFTYQGQLTRNNTLVSGPVNLQITLWDASSGGNQVGAQSINSVPVFSGVFTVTLDFGLVAFAGEARWLEIAVQSAGEVGYTTLAPRQPLTPAPYAVRALTGAGLSLPFSGGASNPGSSSLSVNNTATTGPSIGIYGLSASTAADAIGVAGFSGTGRGIQGNSSSGAGVLGASSTGSGVWGTSMHSRAVYGYSNDREGVWGDSDTGNGVTGAHLVGSAPGHGVLGTTNNVFSSGVFGTTTIGDGVTGYSAAAYKSGVVGLSDNVQGHAGYFRNNVNGGALYAESGGGDAIYAISGSMRGVFGASGSADGVFGQTNGAGKSGIVGLSLNVNGNGGYFRNDGGGTALYVDGRAQTKVLDILGGSDLAEPFNVHSSRPSEEIQAGMVVAIDPDRPGDLKLTDMPYDTKVAGVISGANRLEPGMVMRSQGEPHADGDHAVALAGRVWCWADAAFGPIAPGDLLTSSTTPGMAMRASDTSHTSGAILGKAMTALQSGRGLVLVLVNLQ
jgi:hypothetical protein